MKRFFLILYFVLFSAASHASTGDITAVRIVGSATGVADATSACNTASACTGWVMEIDVSGLSTGGTYALGIGANYSPANAKIVLSVTHPGYDNAASVTTVPYMIWGTHQLRKIYNAGYTPPYASDETVVSSTLTLRIALSEYVYTTDTSLSVAIAGGIYTQGGTPTNAYLGSLTNNSTLTFSAPRAIANWSYPGMTPIRASTFKVRAVGYQRYAHDKHPLAAMVFTCADAHSHSATATVTEMTIDYSMSDAVPVQEYIGTINASSFTQADLITCDFKAVPWVGDSNSIMDSSDGANTMPTPLYSRQFYINDTSGTFGTAAAVVDASAGVDGTCQAVAESAFNHINDNATTHPCLTINKAITIIRAWNAANASPARTDEAGTVYAQAGTYTWTGASVSIGANSGANPNMAWLTITTFPGVARSSVIINGITSTTYNKAGNSPLKISGITINVTSGTPTEVFNSQTAGNYHWLDNDDLTMTSGTTLSFGFGVVYYTRCVASNPVLYGFANYNPQAAALIRGNTLSGITAPISAYTVLGNLFAPVGSNTSFYIQSVETAAPAISNQPIIAYNKLFNLQESGNGNIKLFSTQSNPIGAAVVQNLLEYNSTTTNALMTIAADGTTNTPVNNILLWFNTVVGNRINRSYNDSGSSAVIRTLWSEVGQLYESAAIKSDTFNTANAGRVGNWSSEYGVGFLGSIDAEAGTSGNPVGVANLFQPEFPGLYSKFVPVSSTRDTQSLSEPPGTGAANMNSVAWIAFVNRQARDGVGVGTGNGDYHLTATSPALSMVPAGKAVLPFDIEGNARRNLGGGAAGAYEYGSDPTFKPFWIQRPSRIFGGGISYVPTQQR